MVKSNRNNIDSRINKQDIGKSLLVFAGGVAVGFAIAKAIDSGMFDDIKESVVNMTSDYFDSDTIIDVNGDEVNDGVSDDEKVIVDIE